MLTDRKNDVNATSDCSYNLPSIGAVWHYEYKIWQRRTEDRKARHRNSFRQLVGRITGTFGLAALIALATAECLAQAENRGWGGLGVGVGYVAEGSALEESAIDNAGVGVVYARYQRGASVYSLRGTAATELFGGVIVYIGALYGRAKTEERRHASFSIGLAFVIGNYKV